ncbi:pectate lyase family protein [Roseibacillus ishigakijimensis]|uniref:Pectate lyase domain-containing protein n=1 Tax=Roseibacillus ishigakijimensis TaxID=454146 RepID=A0A934RRS5_9BACT|nr:hypothetical protein [Roseibacillus ishigakijimensis]MBK1834732.1 hypothetical protein [Roseibacillus ishigakijimensis]
MEQQTFGKNRPLGRGGAVLVCLLALAGGPLWAELQADGFAALGKGTSGGGEARPVRVADEASFLAAVKGHEKKVIHVAGPIVLSKSVSIGSHTTLSGVAADAGFSGGAFKIQGENVIVQGLSFGPAKGDLMEISGARRVFVTQCDFRDSSDELCSIVRGADLVTISWCRFFFENPDSHSFAHLIGNSDKATGDRGKLRVTLHHNWYTTGVRGRQPRVRFGQVHLYNNLYDFADTGYAIGTGKECQVRVEATHFAGVRQAWKDHGGSKDGRIGWRHLKFSQGSHEPGYMENSFPVFEVPYEFQPDPVERVAEIVRERAGHR